MHPTDTPVTVVYITGYGRSGSSLLDSILGNHPDVFGSGELTWFFARMKAGDICSCSEKLTDCSVWKQIMLRYNELAPEFSVEDAAAVTLRCERLFGLRRDHAGYHKVWTAMFNAMRDVTGKHVIIDSSKTSRLAVHRVSLLGDTPGIAVKVIHLVRDPRAVMWSSRRGSNRKIEKGQATGGLLGMLRGTFGWLFANIACEVQAKFAGQQRLVVRYEELIKEDHHELNRIAEYIGIDAKPMLELLASGKSLDNGHATGGNRMRRNGAIVLKPDQSWRDQPLGLVGSVLAIVAKPLRSLYGYGD